jgi:hypothetical protein
MTPLTNVAFGRYNSLFENFQYELLDGLNCESSRVYISEILNFVKVIDPELCGSPSFSISRFFFLITVY